MTFNFFKKRCSNVLCSTCVLFCDKKKKNRNLAHNHRFLVQTKKIRETDKILGQCFLKEFKATCKKFGESELKQQRTI